MVVGMTAAELQAEFGMPNAYPVGVNGLGNPIVQAAVARAQAAKNAVMAAAVHQDNSSTFGLTDSMAFGIPNYWIYGAVGLLVVLPWLRKKKKG